jgi:hypothetical protein
MTVAQKVHLTVLWQADDTLPVGFRNVLHNPDSPLHCAYVQLEISVRNQFRSVSLAVYEQLDPRR